VPHKQTFTSHPRVQNTARVRGRATSVTPPRTLIGLVCPSLSVCPSIPPSIYLSTRISIHPSTYIYLSIYLSVCLSVRPAVHPPIYSCCSHLEHRATVKRLASCQILNLRQSVGLLGRGISRLQGGCLHRHRINASTLP
jgi:hypothetical protein